LRCARMSLRDTPRPPRKVNDGAFASINTTDNKENESGANDKGKEGGNKIFLSLIYLLFFFLVSVFIPVVWSRSIVLWSLLASFAFFNVLVFIVKFLLEKCEFYNNLPTTKQLEIVNRAVSIVFNMSVALQAFEIYLGFGPFGLPKLDIVLTGTSWLYDLFCGSAIGYVLYDFLWLVSVYGETSVAILLHHCAEMLMLTASIYDPLVGILYTVSGAVMMLSSAMLHVQRICYLAKVSLETLLIVKYILLFTWVTGRLIATPHLMYIAFSRAPFTYLHAVLLFAGVSLLGMNSLWGWKIATRKNLAF